MTLDVASATDLLDLTDGFAPSFDSADAIDRLPVRYLQLRGLTPGFFVRAGGTDPAHVQMLVEAATSAELPPILVQASNLRIVDGMHRYEAARLRGEETIAARLIDCSDRDAFILAVKANTWHGLPLSRADRMTGARQIVQWHADWSDRAIGIATGLSAKTIAGIRRQSSDEAHPSGKRLGRDGKRRPIAAADGRRRAAEYLAMRPDAPLREIAREADVALATAQDVRARVRHGIDPIATGTRLGAPAENGSRRGTATSSSADWRAGRSDVPGSAAALREADPAHSWPALCPKLANDPSLKYTDGGRAFVNWMLTHVVDGREWQKFVESVPVHWLQHLSQIAARVGQEWLDFAEELHRREGQMG